jgi:hypothetical protein
VKHGLGAGVPDTGTGPGQLLLPFSSVFATSGAHRLSFEALDATNKLRTLSRLTSNAARPA